MKVLIAHYNSLLELWCAPPWVGERLQADFPKIHVVQLPNYRRVGKEIVDAEIYVGWSLRPEQVKAATKLRWIHSPATGVHQLMSPELQASDIIVSNARDVNGPVVAEHALAVIFALAKRLPAAMHYQARHYWALQDMWAKRPRPSEVAGATLVVIGLGSIGRGLAKCAAAVGMHVIGVREHPEKGREAAHEVYGMNDLDVVLARADYVVIAAPLTPRTQYLFNADRLAHMREDAYLINVSRGQLVDEAALGAALRKRQIAGAALDVFNEEPLPADSPLWDLDNVLITPHTATLTERMWERQYTLLTENLRRFLSDRPLLCVVDKAKGY